MSPEEVARYLKQHPEFFEEHAEFLASIHIPHPHAGHAIPLAERQMLSLRDKSRLLESKLRELVQFGEQNDNISERVHRITLALLASPTLSGLLDSLHHNLREDFLVPGTAVRLWQGAALPDRAEFAEVSSEVRVFAESLTAPYFSDHPMFDSAAWLQMDAATVRSTAYLPLRAEQAFGLLVLASDDAARFAPDQGTLYLTRLGEIVSMAFKRFAGD